MRAWFAILFSLLVATVQPAVMANDVAAATTSACCTGCPSPCCQEKAPAESTPIPASPARSISQDDWQFIFAFVAHFTLSPTDTPQQNPSRLCSSVRTSPVPIFQRNCTYLI